MNPLLRMLAGILFNRNRRPVRPGGSGAPPRGVPSVGWRPSPSTRRMIIAAVILFGLLFAVYATSAFWVNWWWFGSVGYRSVLTTRYLAQAVAFLLGGLAAGAFFAANWTYALQRSRGVVPRPGAVPAGSRLLRFPLWAVSAVVFLVAGLGAAEGWETWLLFLEGGRFGIDDPLFGRDAGFYVFTVPALGVLQRGAFTLLLVTIVATVVLYALLLGLGRADLRRPPRPARTHVLALAGGLLLLIGVGYLLANYRLLYSTRGVVYGAGFTDAWITRFANYALALISVTTAALLLSNAFVRRLRLLLIACGVWVLAAVLVGEIVPAVVQQTYVEPSELRRERPYIEHNIRLTRAAYGLTETETRDLSGQGEPPPAALSPQAPAFDNIRLWDYRIVRETFRQLRSFVPYYVFGDVDVDRYEIDGRTRQVVVAARELNADGLPPNAQTWVNRHLVYTHGYGVVVSPVSEATRQGLPVFLVGGIPPEGTGTLAIERPEIYFGEVPAEWVAVNTGQAEVSGIQGETATEPYTGKARGSIGLGSYPRRLILATFLGDRRILFSGELGGDSRVLLRRQVAERAREIAPFLSYDGDPYLVITDGRLTWVIDAYTETDRFPNATPIEGLNYVRHAAKVTVDAYDGTVTFYRTGIADPIADAYGAIFEDLFTPIAEAPASLAAHFRYPERLFDLQSEVFASYHVTDPDDFYNGEDRWEIAREEVDEVGGGGGVVRRMEAYYLTLPLPGETEAGFGLVLPFTPNNRQNMTAWMAAQTDAAGVPRLVVYTFPRQVTIFGPEQVEARINQEPEISSQITLLSQSGSQVIRGNLLVIPIEETVLYAQPLYVRATGTAGAPTELKYVIVATNEQVVMRPTLPEALAALAAGQTGGDVPPAPPLPSDDGEAAEAPVISAEDGALVQQALDAYERAQTALATGDWGEYGEEQATLERVLRQLAGDGGASAAGTPEAGATPTP